MTFVDNHDVTRLASILTNKKHIPLAYGLLMGMPGIPCLYYGSEWLSRGRKHRIMTMRFALALKNQSQMS